jgi:hypothetical protein
LIEPGMLVEIEADAVIGPVEGQAL